MNINEIIGVLTNNIQEEKKFAKKIYLGLPTTQIYKISLFLLNFDGFFVCLITLKRKQSKARK